MAIAIGDSAGERLVRTASLPSATSYTICGWYMRRGDHASGDWNTVFSLAVDTVQYHILYGRDGAADNRFNLYIGGNQTGYVLNLYSNDVWHFIAISCAGTSATDGKLFAGAAGSTTLSTASVAGQTMTPTSMMINANGPWTEESYARYSNVMVYDSVLTQAQLTRQFLSGQYRPVIWENLHAWYPMLPGEDRLKDYSGNAKTLTLNSGTITEELANPLAWGWHTSYQPYAPAAGTPERIHNYILKPVGRIPAPRSRL